jgi:hypothetical protein
MKTSILIVYESANREKAFPLAQVYDHELLLAAARSAIDEKRLEARRICTLDNVLGTVAAEEANRLERTLKALIPELGLEDDAGTALTM